MYICYHIVVACIVDLLHQNKSIHQSMHHILFGIASMKKIEVQEIWCTQASFGFNFTF